MSSGVAGWLSGRWFRLIVVASAALLVLTFVAYALEAPGVLSRLLFRFSLGGENNIGAWWSGMLLLLAAALAFDGYADRDNGERERRGWLALAGALLLMSFDEVASLHEYLAGKGLRHLAVLGVLGAGVAGYALLQLYRAGAGRRVLGPLATAFALLALVPVHEIVQQSFEWRNPAIYGLRALLEEGTELIAIVLFVHIAQANSARLLARSGDVLAAVAHHRTALLTATALLLPVLTAATFVLPFPGGPADWLAASMFVACALLAVRGLLLGRLPGRRAVLLLCCYLAASMLTNAVALGWDPVVYGRPVGLRGVAFTILLLAAVPILRSSGRRLRGSLFGLAALGTAVGALWPQSQALWCALPAAVGLWFYAIESKAALAAAPRPRGAAAPGLVPAALPLNQGLGS